MLSDHALVGRVQSKNLRRVWGMPPISVAPSSKLAFPALQKVVSMLLGATGMKW
jgi:hypothetical protein